MAENKKPALFTSLSPDLLHLYDVTKSVVVIIDVLRATSTIAAALFNGAKEVIPVSGVDECIRKGKQTSNSVTAGERDGHVAEGLEHGNSPFEYGSEFISGKTLVLTTTNGTRLLHMAFEKGAHEIITASFSNISDVCEHLLKKNQPVLLACAAWKNKINMEDTLCAGAIIHTIKYNFTIDCDASQMAESLYISAKDDLYGFIKAKNASHFSRLSGFGLDKDIRHCLVADTAPVLPLYFEGSLINKI